ncbi:zinc finger protein 385D-like isoform X2 [Dunckerocampus dactyliophorus]|uniref:zinc finger protein 385D-like isoform X2 n=1 Tax=Dunckerocampus dactyliophorus TaxID=161453 RepID=UPI002405A4C4|nr:zinc finger protein 385D-like isoform X2 [Dunckerocampus dactyliophorus]
MECGSSGEAEEPPSPCADMKCPRMSDCLESSLPPKSQEEDDDGNDKRKVAPGHRGKRERRQGSSASATVCQVCNIQLNSGAQAQIHYKGKTHQRRLRRLAKVLGALSQNQVHPLLSSLPLSGRASLQPQNHLEHFLPLNISSSSPFSLFSHFNTMDPVQKAVINHTFGVAPPRRRTVISCNICHLRFNSTSQADAHYKGHRHARKLKALENQRNRQRNGQSVPTVEKDRGKETGAMGGSGPQSDMQLKEGTVCSDLSTSSQQQENGPGSCLVHTPSSQLTSIDSSSSRSPQPSQHIPQLCYSTLEGPHMDDCTPLRPTSRAQCDPQEPPAGGEEELAKVYAEDDKNDKKHLHCPTCKVTVNSSSQLEAHCSGSKHKQMIDIPSSSQSHRRAKRTSSPRHTCQIIKQRTGSKTKALVGIASKRFHCELCQVAVNSETQLKQHMNSRRHKERLAGKPVRVRVKVKAKFTPFNKLQPTTALATKLALQKQLSKALPAGFLTSPLNPAALCAMASAPLALRLPQGPAAIVHGPLISPTLFRPAPGPLRPTHAPIIFSPY